MFSSNWESITSSISLVSSLSDQTVLCRDGYPALLYWLFGSGGRGHELGSTEGARDSDYPQDYVAPVPVSPGFEHVCSFAVLCWSCAYLASVIEVL